MSDAPGATAHSGARLIPPPNGVTVRMYRIGHGDCFLLAFPGASPNEPVYVLIDCGYKPGSPKFLSTTAKQVCDSIREATGGHIHVAVITHEHQDHVNGITETNFADVTIGETWFAWTEDPADDMANQLRTRFKDRLALLMTARNHLAADGSAATKVAHIDDFLAFELGGEEETFNPNTAFAADGGVENSQNKRAMKLFKTKAANGVRYLRPHDKAVSLAGSAVRVFPLGPPRDVELLHSLDPEGDEAFPDSGGSNAFGAAPDRRYFAASVEALESGEMLRPPFSSRYRLKWNDAFRDSFWANYYGNDEAAPFWPDPSQGEKNETAANAAWRRIDKDWLYSSDQLALDMNNDTNNGSLVLAFELSPGGKVLLFAADAQRGNWRSWTKGEWSDGERTVTIHDLLARTVLYKVGHHGSHNATLHGDSKSDYANLDWMATSREAAGEFTAMITAVRAWAETQKGWDHPQKAIKDALLHKASGRVLQTDTDLEKMKSFGNEADWQAFLHRTKFDGLFIDHTVEL